MTPELLLWLTGGLAMLFGTMLLFVLAQRLRPRRVRPAHEASRSARRRRGRRPRDPAAKICPACGSRYALEARVCARDRSELSLLN